MQQYFTTRISVLLAMLCMAAEPLPLPPGGTSLSGAPALPASPAFQPSAPPSSGPMQYSTGPITQPVPADMPGSPGAPIYPYPYAGGMPPGPPYLAGQPAYPLQPGQPAPPLQPTSPVPAAPPVQQAPVPVSPGTDSVLPSPRMISPGVPSSGMPTPPLAPAAALPPRGLSPNPLQQTAPPAEDPQAVPAAPQQPQWDPFSAAARSEELRRDIGRLQAERRALAAERASLSDTLTGLRGGSQQDAPCAVTVQSQIRALMEQLRQHAQQRHAPTVEASPTPPVDRPAATSLPTPQAHPPQQPEPSVVIKAVPGTHPAAESKTKPPAEKHSLPRGIDIRTDAPIEPLALAQALFRAGDYDGALRAYRELERSNPSSEMLVSIQYMMASCLRRLGKVDEATSLFREVAANDTDEVLAETAQWQIQALKTRGDLDAKLAQLKERRRTMQEKKP